MTVIFSMPKTWIFCVSLVASQTLAAPVDSGPKDAVQTPEIHAQGMRLIAENVSVMESLLAVEGLVTNEASGLQAVSTCPEGNKPFAIPATVGAPVVCPVNPAHNIK